jgi:hypothetical protein
MLKLQIFQERGHNRIIDRAGFPLLNDIEHNNADAYAEGRSREFPRLRAYPSPQTTSLKLAILSTAPRISHA